MSSPVLRQVSRGSAVGPRLGFYANIAVDSRRRRSPSHVARCPLHSVKYVNRQEGDWWLGYLEEYPDYWTQGETLQDLVEHLKDLYLDLSGGNIPNARKVGELVMP